MILNIEEIEKEKEKNLDFIEPLIIPENERKPGRIMLHLGDKCYCSSNPNCIIDVKKETKVEITPNSIFLFQTKERVNFPKYLVGHMSLKMGLIQKGLIMSNQTQIDPGYNNYLYGMLYNLSTSSITLNYGDSITSLEVESINESSTNYSGVMSKMNFETFVANRIESSLGELSSNVETSIDSLKSSTKRWNHFINFITLIFTVLSIVIACVSLTKSPDIAKMEVKIEHMQEKISEQKEKIEYLQNELQKLNDIRVETEHFNNELEN